MDNTLASNLLGYLSCLHYFKYQICCKQNSPEDAHLLLSIFFTRPLAFPVLIYHSVILWPAFPSVLVNVWIISLFMSSFCYLCSIFLLFGCWASWTNHLMLSSFSSHSHLFVLLLYFLWNLSQLDFLKLLSFFLLWFTIWSPFLS